MLCSWPYSMTPKTNVRPILWGWYVGAYCSSWTFNSKLVTYFSPQALQWDQKSNQLWFSNHKSAQEIRVAICPSNLARKFVSFSQPASQLVRHFPRVNHSTEAETLGMKNSQNINILMADLDQQQHLKLFLGTFALWVISLFKEKQKATSADFLPAQTWMDARLCTCTMHKCVSLDAATNQPSCHCVELSPCFCSSALNLCLHWLCISSPWRGSTSVPVLGKRRVFVIKWSPASAQAHSGGKLLDRSMQVISNPIRVTFRKLDLLETGPAGFSNMSDISNSSTKWCILCCESKCSWHRSL